MHTMNGHNGASLTRHASIATELSAHNTIPVASQMATEFARLVTRWSHRARSRRALATMEPRLLLDIGLTREAALREAEKPFWR